MDSIASIVGVYSVDYNAVEGTLEVSGEVDPNKLVRTAMRCDQHAKLLRAKITHPEIANRNNNRRPNNNCNDDDNNNHCYPAIEYGQHNHTTNGDALLLEGGFSGNDYNSGYSSNYPTLIERLEAEDYHSSRCGPMPEAVYVPSKHRSMDWSHYDRMRAEENWCTIM
ncbi:OLC1v1022516C2 [Oldenlandia corymbosa var. corymbosa]|nr:OLC1v1022516C2 [Oldenlandia corymbosa var. corymbosa]